MSTRLEKVVLDLEDKFSGGIAKDAAAVALLRRELDSLSGTSVRTSRSAKDVDRSLTGIGSSSRRTGGDINRLTGRLRLFADAAAILGPGLVPIVAVGVPAVTGLATAIAAVGTAGAGALIALHGVGDAIKAVETARLDPTVAHLNAAELAMKRLGPDAQEFVRAFQDFRPVLSDIQDAAAEGLFPGLTESLASFEELGPKIERILREVNEASGEALANGVESLTTERWRPFFNFLAREMPAAITSLSHIVGDLTHGMAELWMTFDPGNDSFLKWLEGVADGFDKWSQSAEATEGVQEFLAYVAETGPEVADLFGSLVNLLVQVSQAAAPIGGPVLKGLTAVADALAAIADSDAGTELLAAAAAMSVLSRASAGYAAVNKTMWVQSVKGNRGMLNMFTAMQTGTVRAAAGVGLLATSMTDLDEKAGLANTTTGLLLGTMLKGAKGGIYGTAIGLTLDLVSANDDLAKAVESANAVMTSGDLKSMKAELDALRESMGAFADIDPRHETSLESLWAGFTNLPSIVDSMFGDDEIAMAHDAANALEADIAFLESRIRGFGQAGDGLATMLGRPLGEIDRSFETATMSAAEFAAEIERLNGVLSDRASMRDYEAAIDAVNASLKENGRTLDETTPKGRANQEVLDSIAASALKVSENMKAAQRTNFLRGARDDFVQAATAFGMTRKAARALADELGLLGRTKVPPPKVDLDDSKFRRKMRGVSRDVIAANDLEANPFVDLYTAPFDQGAQHVDSEIARLNGKQITITTVYNEVKRKLGIATGGHVQGPGTGTSDSIPAMISNGEFVVNAASTKKNLALLHAINAEKFANGGLAGGNAESALEILNMIAGIRDLKRQLAADGKDALHGLNRRIANLQLQVAEKELRLAKHREEREARQEARDKAREIRSNLQGIGSGFSLDSLVPGPELTVAQQAAQEIVELRKQILEAGGVWTKGLTRWAKGLIAAASELDDVNAALAAETAKRDALVQTISDQQQALDSLNATMESFGNQVAGNFKNNPFNQTITGGSPSAELTDARSALAAIRNSPTGDSVQAAAMASKLIEQIAKLEAEQSTVGGLEAFKKTLLGDIESAEKFAAVLKQLEAMGLDTTGALGGLYQQLAASGDLTTATELAALTAGQIDEYEKLFAARENAAAVLAAQTTQAIYGQQQAILTTALALSQGQLVQMNANIATLEATAAALGVDIRAMAPDVATQLKPQLDKLKHSIEDVAPDRFAEKLRRMGAVK